jgi:hypothetical protein
MDHHVDRPARLGSWVLIIRIWYNPLFTADYLEQISADLNREGDSQVTLDERFWRH